MKKILYTAALALLAVSASGQYEQLLPPYLVNDLLHNPAIAGSKAYNPGRLTVRRQWAGVQQSPQMQSFSFDGLLFQYRIGMGGSIVNQVTGPTSFSTLNYYWNYRFPFSANSMISFGLAPSVSQYLMDHRVLKLEEPDDELLRSGFRTTYIPEGSAGLYLYSTPYNPRQYYLGLSVMNMVQSSKGLPWHDNQVHVVQLPREYRVMAAYRLKVAGRLALEPSAMVRTANLRDPEVFEYTGNARIVWNDSLWIGASYVKDRSAAVMISFVVGQLNILYAYEIPLTDIQSYFYANHQISLAIYFQRREIKTL